MFVLYNTEERLKMFSKHGNPIKRYSEHSLELQEIYQQECVEEMDEIRFIFELTKHQVSKIFSKKTDFSEHIPRKLTCIPNYIKHKGRKAEIERNEKLYPQLCAIREFENNYYESFLPKYKQITFACFNTVPLIEHFAWKHVFHLSPQAYEDLCDSEEYDLETEEEIDHFLFNFKNGHFYHLKGIEKCVEAYGRVRSNISNFGDSYDIMMK